MTCFFERMEEIEMTNTKLLEDFHRQDVVQFLSGTNNTGIELGVAQGIFSERMIQLGKFSNYLGVE
tara:strand:- start:1357 stop:1554 length:198 start_codon:yes stop_codon:yes gene_type:complete